MKKVFLLFFASVVFIFCSGFTVPNHLLENGTAYESAMWINDNLSEISKAANEEGYDISIEACVMQPILIHTENGTEEGYFIDFNDDNGYIVVGDKLTIYDLVFSEQSVAKDEILKDFEYDIHNGYNYYGKELTDNSVINNIEMEKISKYDGTNSGGYITDLPKYVADRYGKEYKLNVSKRVTNMDGELQTDNSIYYESKNGFSYSEGNCGLISAFNYLKYMYNNRGFSRIPYSSKIKYDASILEPKIYDKKLKDSNYTVRNNKNISKALSDIRQEAYRINGGPEGLTVWESRKLLDYAMKEYGYSTRFKVIEIWDYNTVTSRIDKGQGLLWSVFGHQTYGSHTMFVSGYNTYVKTGKFLWWTTYSYKEFFILKDGHYKTDKFYDFNGFNGGVVVGGFVVEK